MNPDKNEIEKSHLFDCSDIERTPLVFRLRQATIRNMKLLAAALFDFAQASGLVDQESMALMLKVSLGIFVLVEYLFESTISKFL